MIHNNFQFNTIWHWQSMAALVLCWWLAGSNITVTQSVMGMIWLCWWYNHAADVVSPSTAFAFVYKMSENCKSTLPSAIQVKNWQNIINIEEKFVVISWLEKGEQIGDICRSVKFACSSIYTICDNADKITQSAISGSKVFVTKTTTVLSEWTIP
jgi:hypothetical protein